MSSNRETQQQIRETQQQIRDAVAEIKAANADAHAKNAAALRSAVDLLLAGLRWANSFTTSLGCSSVCLCVQMRVPLPKRARS